MPGSRMVYTKKMNQYYLVEEAFRVQVWRKHRHSDSAEMEVIKASPTQLLCIFVHGFKGTDDTFGTFPDRLQHVLSSSGSSGGMKVECAVFPAYETKGELSAATERFVDWLTTTVVHTEVAEGSGGGAGKVKIVLLGHSMGGLLIADALLAIAHTRPSKTSPLWPRIIACIAFDTPYYGLHPFVFKNSASKAVEYAKTAHQVATGLGLLGGLGAGLGLGASSNKPQTKAKSNAPATAPDSSRSTSKEATTQKHGDIPPQPAKPNTGWSKWAPALYGLGGAVIAGAAAGTAYYKRDDLTSGVNWAGDHLKYVGNLWDEKSLRYRVDSLIAVRKESGVLFHNFYTCLPANRAHSKSRSFIVVPRDTSEAFKYHTANHNSLAEDEIQAHTGMFEASLNDGFYDLGLKTADIIQRALDEARGVENHDTRDSMKNDSSIDHSAPSTTTGVEVGEDTIA